MTSSSPPSVTPGTRSYVDRHGRVRPTNRRDALDAVEGVCCAVAGVVWWFWRVTQGLSFLVLVIVLAGLSVGGVLWLYFVGHTFLCCLAFCVLGTCVPKIIGSAYRHLIAETDEA